MNNETDYQSFCYIIGKYINREICIGVYTEISNDIMGQLIFETKEMAEKYLDKFLSDKKDVYKIFKVRICLSY